MSGIEIMTWLLKCGDLTTVSKLQAIKKNIATGNPIYFSTPESYDNFDFSIEPSESYQQLCKEEAQRIRDSFKKVIVWYSGGCDSHFVLNTFFKFINIILTSFLFILAIYIYIYICRKNIVWEHQCIMLL